MYNFIRFSAKIFSVFVYRPISYFAIWLELIHGFGISRSIKNKGKDLRIHGKIQITDVANFKIGSHCRIGRGCFFLANGGIEIGSNVQISRDVIIYSANHNFHGEILPYDNTYNYAKVEIGNSVWLGMACRILPGVKIGDGAIIGMGAIITKDVQPGKIVVGFNKVVGERNELILVNSAKEAYFFGKLFPDS